MSEPAEPIVCATYTHARRHPMVLGSIAGWSPPFQLTVTQLAVLAGSFMAMLWSRSLWSPLLPGSLGTIATIGIPILATWAVRRVRVEGRSIARTGLGWLLLWCAPRTGTVAGRPATTSRPTPLGATRLYVAATPTPETP